MYVTGWVGGVLVAGSIMVPSCHSSNEVMLTRVGADPPSPLVIMCCQTLSLPVAADVNCPAAGAGRRAALLGPFVVLFASTAPASRNTFAVDPARKSIGPPIGAVSHSH